MTARLSPAHVRMTFGGGLLALRLEAYRAFVLAFAAGALVASALIDLIPDALELIERSGTQFPHHHLMFACSLGFLSFYLLEQISHSDHHRDDLAPRHTGMAGLWGAAGIGVHSLLDGVAIGEAFHAGAAWVDRGRGRHRHNSDVQHGRHPMTPVGTRVVNRALASRICTPWRACPGLSHCRSVRPSFWAVLGRLPTRGAALIPRCTRSQSSRWLPAATFSGVLWPPPLSGIN